jgi:YesN/AraC family two-component response regulator
VQFQGKTILIIDDEPMIREALRDHFVEQGAMILEAENGAKALALIHETSKIDLVITDIIMPDRDGIAVIRHLHKNHPQIKVIAISGGGFVGKQDYLQAARQLGADGVLAKPFNVGELDRIITAL